MLHQSHFYQLHEAVRNGCYTQVRYLLKYETDVNVVDNKQRTPLMIAAMTTYKSSRVQLSISQFLLSHHPDVNRTDCKGRTAFIYACKAGKLGIVRIFLKETLQDLDIGLQDNYGMTALMYASKIGNTEMVKHILIPMKKFGIPLDTENVFGKTAIDIAMQKKYHDVVEELYYIGCRTKTAQKTSELHTIINNKKTGQILKTNFRCVRSNNEDEKKNRNILNINQRRSKSARTYKEEHKMRNSKTVLTEMYKLYSIQLAPSYKTRAQSAPLTVPGSKDFDCESCTSIDSFRSEHNFKDRRKSGLDLIMFSLQRNDDNFETSKRKLPNVTRQRKISAPVITNRALLTTPAQKQQNVTNLERIREMERFNL